MPVAGQQQQRQHLALPWRALRPMQGFIDGLGLLPKLPRVVLELALKVRPSACCCALLDQQVLGQHV